MLIRTGVISNNGIVDFIADLVPNDAIDLTFEEAFSEFLADNEIAPDELYRTKEEDDKVQEWIDGYECDESVYLIGGWTVNESTNQYEPITNDTNKYGYSAMVRPFVTQVVYSQTFLWCTPCSPCYPNQGDLDSPLDATREDSVLCYDLPADSRDPVNY
jgi:hypothetical protein|tara:strand:- start:2141 stop:2617 length:477 start_codon:yes stop_codon:yes gene_type:complete